MPEVDSRTVFVPLATAQSLFNLGDAVSEIEVMATDPSNIAPLAAAIRGTLAGQPLRVADWQRTNSSI